jgi:hypothetical protein
MTTWLKGPKHLIQHQDKNYNLLVFIDILYIKVSSKVMKDNKDFRNYLKPIFGLIHTEDLFIKNDKLYQRGSLKFLKIDRISDEISAK